MSSVLVLQTQDNCPPGLVGDWAVRRGMTLDVMRVDRWDSPPVPSEYELAVVLGSDASLAESPGGWVGRLVDWLAAIDAAGLPILGICFGAQALASALGGSVVRLTSPEHAWIELVTIDGDRIPAGPWVSLHEDAIVLPPSADELARNACGPQAFSIGAHLGVQFHPEVTPSILSRWVSDKDGLISCDMLDDLDARCRVAARGALQLFDAFAAGHTRAHPPGRPQGVAG
jgi:GMP synthase-like glutamine amidotransferase